MIATKSLPHIIEQLGPSLWAVHKPAGMRIHPSVGRSLSLTDWLVADIALPNDIAPAHRLELDASGVVLCGSPTARRMVAEWLRKRLVHRSYYVLVCGRIGQGGTIEQALADHRRGRPLPALTTFQVDERLGDYTLVEATAGTGRKRQVRRHFASIGHPVVGDVRRLPRDQPPVPGDPGRLWQHAWCLKLPGGRVVRDPLPEQLSVHLEILRGGRRGADEADRKVA